MRLVVFGLTVSSSWGNGHATPWRGLVRALHGRGHRVVFFERDVPYYRDHRDLHELPGGELVLYGDWMDALPTARWKLAEADVVIVTSSCPDARAATELAWTSNVHRRVFYDLDTPVTLDLVRAGKPVPWVGPGGLGGFDLVLSCTGGKALEELETRLGARRTAPLYGHVDPDAHRPVPPDPRYDCDLSWLGTFAADRQHALEQLLIAAARRLPHRRFLLGGSQYPAGFPWTDNLFFVHHVPSSEHAAFFCSSRLTLNVTRRVMADAGYCPSGRLFEAAACGTPVLSDAWEGLESFYEPGAEILVARGTDDAVAAIDRSDEELLAVARRARERTLAEHTSGRRAAELESLLDDSALRHRR